MAPHPRYRCSLKLSVLVSLLRTMEGLGSHTGGSTSITPRPRNKCLLKPFVFVSLWRTMEGLGSRTGGSTSIALGPRYRCSLKPLVFVFLGRTTVSLDSHRDGWWQVAGTGVCWRGVTLCCREEPWFTSTLTARCSSLTAAWRWARGCTPRWYR